MLMCLAGPKKQDNESITERLRIWRWCPFAIFTTIAIVSFFPLFAGVENWMIERGHGILHITLVVSFFLVMVLTAWVDHDTIAVPVALACFIAMATFSLTIHGWACEYHHDPGSVQICIYYQKPLLTLDV